MLDAPPRPAARRPPTESNEVQPVAHTAQRNSRTPDRESRRPTRDSYKLSPDLRLYATPPSPPAPQLPAMPAPLPCITPPPTPQDHCCRQRTKTRPRALQRHHHKNTHSVDLRACAAGGAAAVEEGARTLRAASAPAASPHDATEAFEPFALSRRAELPTRRAPALELPRRPAQAARSEAGGERRVARGERRRGAAEARAHLAQRTGGRDAVGGRVLTSSSEMSLWW